MGVDKNLCVDLTCFCLLPCSVYNHVHSIYETVQWDCIDVVISTPPRSSRRPNHDAPQSYISRSFALLCQGPSGRLVCLRQALRAQLSPARPPTKGTAPHVLHSTSNTCNVPYNVMHVKNGSKDLQNKHKSAAEFGPFSTLSLPPASPPAASSRARSDP